MEYVFWFSIFAAIYPYVLFPAALRAASVVVRRREAPDRPHTAPSEHTPPFSVIVCAYNEEENIVRKIRDILPALALNPKNELIVVSDYSTDGTVAVARSMTNPQI